MIPYSKVESLAACRMTAQQIADVLDVDLNRLKENREAAWEIWSKTLTGETVPFSFTLSNGEGAYTFSFPKVQVSGEWPDGGNSDIIRSGTAQPG
ncbi:hypothetical protein HCH97_08805 [Escherichia coli]|nr:hypothetical protein [Escherichia coli]EEW1581994.1 hypothetical protein [Escherichia coli]EGJ6209744.1 hypothetical protein [Escherichia coli]MBI0778281.1 hypothetical protein [Escherichia coli]MEB7013351.1 hypothetical protein [Escherichia coli]MEB7027686.1 hypothetical protein [Escherichia coli]